MAFCFIAEVTAAQVNLKRLVKQPRKSKSKTPPRVRDPKHPHISTAKLLSPGQITPRQVAVYFRFIDG